MTTNDSAFDRSPAQNIPTATRRGFVLPTVMFSVALMSIVVVAAINTASDERRTSRATREATLALYAAEGGLRQVYGSWPSVAVKALNPGDSLNLGWVSLPNRASYRAVIHRVDKGGLQEYNVVVQGRRRGESGGVATILGVVGGIPVLTYGVFSKTNVSLGPNGSIDSYDSEVAPYNAAAPDTNATIWANGNLHLNNMNPVRGDVNAAGAITTAGTVVVQGERNAGVDPAPEMDVLTCPAGGFTPAAQMPPNSLAGLGLTYNAMTGSLTLNSGYQLNLTGANYYFSSINIAGGASLRVTPPVGGRTEIVVSNQVTMSGNAIVNTSNAPTTLGISSCGSPASPALWTVTGGGQAAYSVYAPNHPVTLTGGGALYGAIVGAPVTVTGNSHLHYDEALARLASKKLIVQKGTWAMLPGN